MVDARRERAAHGMKAGDEEAKAFWGEELGRLAAVEDGLCFGRLDMRDGRRIYVGRLGLFRDGQDEPLLVDWRAAAARPFYTATMAKADGVRRRRRITTRGRTVTAVDDELLDRDAASDSELVGEAALMAALTADRTGRMHDIVTTLQAEQDAIVRDDYAGVLVVQGGPGTGKTAVALHRLAYLLYTRAHLRTRGVLVIGPSRVFLDYIGQVLPGLGEQAVVTATIAGLYPGVQVNGTGPAEDKGRADMADKIAAVVRSRVRVPEESLKVHFEQQVLRLESDDCRRAVAAARRTGLPHNQARLVCHQHVVELLAQGLVNGMENVVLTETGESLDGGSADGRLSAADLRALAAAGVVLDPDQDDGPRRLADEIDPAQLRAALLADPGVAEVLDDLWPALTAAEVVAEMLPAGEWTAADIPLLDEASALIGEFDGTTYGHVVVDEAQELSAMAWRMLMRRCPTKSMTVVGDLAQTSDLAGAVSWGDMLRPHVSDRWRLAELTVNYRTPTEIMDAAADLFAAHHADRRPPRSVRSAGEEPWRLECRPAELLDVVAGLAAQHTRGQLAIIAKAHHREITAALSLPTPADVTAPVVVLTPGEAKGLEFDAVLIVDPAGILAGPLGHNDLYVAMTRATQQLGIVHPGPPPAELARIHQIRMSHARHTCLPAARPDRM
ncbi:HelD family protein [Kutzneria chonburiensis]|uniref:HelD family protein n=1 Tax=Kutzneria chonburiensis TaxID=1483604 RepID=A0ABV6MK68_9PSEU|nr:ATP-binding domain-containing protein [Kutzneria chonburiensis]